MFVSWIRDRQKLGDLATFFRPKATGRAKATRTRPGPASIFAGLLELARPGGPDIYKLQNGPPGDIFALGRHFGAGRK